MTSAFFALTEYCRIHNVEPGFIYSLQREGLISITVNEEEQLIEEEQLHDLEIYTRWHSQLGINPEGIDVVRQLVDKLRNMQEQVNYLKNRLRMYEDPD